MAEHSVTVRLKHQTSRQGVYWCDPIGWEPENPDPANLEECDGALYDRSDLEGEEAFGLAVWLGRHDGEEDEEVEAFLFDVYWRQSGFCEPEIRKVTIAN